MLIVQNSEMGYLKAFRLRKCMHRNNVASRCNLLHGVATRCMPLQNVSACYLPLHGVTKRYMVLRAVTALLPNGGCDQESQRNVADFGNTGEVSPDRLFHIPHGW